MKQITKAELLDGIETGEIEVLTSIIDFQALNQTVYGKRSLEGIPKSFGDREKRFEIVYTTI